eukprot:gene4366-5333_t
MVPTVLHGAPTVRGGDRDPQRPAAGARDERLSTTNDRDADGAADAGG